MKYLGIDYGTKKVGIAISDDGGTFAFPKAIVATPQALSEIVALCASEYIDGIVIGRSVASNGADNDIVPLAEKFKKALSAATGLPVSYQQELFSSVEAHRYQTKAGNRDDSAAAIILQRYLDARS